MDVYGAYLAYTDHEIGRVIQAVEDLGERENTLIIYIGGDNGASAEGGLNGTPNEFTYFNGVTVPVKDQFLWYPFWGSDRTFPHFSVGWAWAMDTPFKWVKQVASHFGGTAQGMVISWPGHITDEGGIRRQFGHVIDIVPTILEVTGIPAPRRSTASRRSRSRAPAWSTPGTRPMPTRRPGTPPSISRCSATARSITTAGSRRRPRRRSRGKQAPGTPPDVITGYKWELYHVAEDPTENNDLGAADAGQAQGDAGSLLRRGREVRGAAARQLDARPLRSRRGRA